MHIDKEQPRVLCCYEHRNVEITRLEGNTSVVKIRLMRTGQKGAPSYRIVVADSRSPRDGRFLEIIGWYNPLTHPSTVQIDEPKAIEWMQKGAQPSEGVSRLFRTNGLTERFAATKAAAAAE